MPESYDPIQKFFFMIRNNNSMILDIISNCKDNEQKKSLAKILVNFFYENIFSTNYIEEPLLMLIYLILEKEIDQLQQTNIIERTSPNESFSSLLFIQLGYKEDIKAYLSLILNNLILEMDNKEDNALSLHVEKISQVYLNRKQSDQETLFRSSNQVEMKSYEQTDFHKTFGIKESPEENNEMMTQSYYPSTINSNHSTELDDDHSRVNSLCFSRITAFSSTEPIYELTKNELVYKMKNEKNLVIKEFIIKQISQMAEDQSMYLSHDFLYKLKQYHPHSKKVATIYKDNFIKVKNYIKALLFQLEEYKEIIPLSIKCISKIMSMLIKRKFPKISIIDQNAFVSKFIFDQLIFPFFYAPDNNGILTNTIISPHTRHNIKSITTILKHVIDGKLFNGKIDPNYVLFNPFFLEIIPSISDYFESLNQIQLPSCIERLFNEKDNPSRNINYDFIAQNPENNMEHQSICMSWSDIDLFYDIVNENQSVFSVKEYGMLIKHFGKITFKIDIIKDKVEEEQENLTKTYLLFTKMNMTKEVEDKLKFTTEEKVSFQNVKGQDSKSILPRIKYCLKKILNYLQSLSNEELNPNLTTEEIVFLLFKRLELEEQAISFFEGSIPLTWYCLYLKTNLITIPSEYKENNYTKLFTEMITEAESSFNKCDHTMINQLRIKTKNSTKKNQVLCSNLFKLKQIEKYISIHDFVERAEIPVCICYANTLKEEKILMMNKIGQCIHTKFGYLDTVCFQKQNKKYEDENHCLTINNFISKFPNLLHEKEFIDTTDDLIDYAKKLKVPEVIHNYFKILQESLKTDKISKNYNSEIDTIYHELTSYIMTKLYKKLYTEFPEKIDNDFFKKCVELDWVQPQSIVHENQIIDVKLWESAMIPVNQMDREKSPLKKINAFSQASMIIQNSITFCSGKNDLGVDDCINAFIYMVLKSKPKRIVSNMKFIELYLNKDLMKKDKGLLLAQLKMIITVIEKMDHTSTGVTSEEWAKNCYDTLNIPE